MIKIKFTGYKRDIRHNLGSVKHIKTSVNFLSLTPTNLPVKRAPQRFVAGPLSPFSFLSLSEFT